MEEKRGEEKKWAVERGDRKRRDEKGREETRRDEKRKKERKVRKEKYVKKRDEKRRSLGLSAFPGRVCLSVCCPSFFLTLWSHLPYLSATQFLFRSLTNLFLVSESPPFFP
jgi:hypothetical protein